MNTKKIMKDRNEMIEFSQNILKNIDKYLILDTETTGLEKNDVIIQIGLINLKGEVLMNTFLKPAKKKRISKEATAIHGINMEMLSKSPSLKEVHSEFSKIVKGKTLLIYNAEYDARLYRQTCQQEEINMINIDALCIMKAYSAFIGDWSDEYGNYRYQKLPVGDHSATGDCLATLKVIQEMSESKKMEIKNKKWWQFGKN